MNTTQPETDLFEQRQETIAVRGAELLAVCAQARSGALHILSLQVVGNGSYQLTVRHNSDWKQPAEERR